jgi:(p)ppGpp synthase/HD superfamily hydrolase
MSYSEGVERALRVAIEAHDGQFRKGDDNCPYSVHPVHVALLLARLGLEEAVVQAGLLHDVIEDCADWDRERVAEEFGPRVAGIVAELTEDKSKTWAERKQAGIDAVAGMSVEALMVKAADKLHNMQSLRVALERSDDRAAVWNRFSGKREGTLRVAEELVAELVKRADPRLGEELAMTVERLREL